MGEKLYRQPVSRTWILPQQIKKTDGNIYLKANYDLTSTLSAYADLQYRHIDYTIDGVNDKYDWNKNALRPLAVDKKFDFFNPKVGLNWNITPNHRLYASFSVAQKEPTRNNYTDGDPDSYPKAEKLLDYEAGYTFANPWLTAGANFYYMDYTDQLVLTGALNDIGEALTENIPDSYRMGIELMLGIKPCKWFQWDINATWSKNRIKDFVESLPGYHYNADETVTSLPTVLIKHKDTHIAFSPDFLLNNRFSFNYKGFEASLQSAVCKQTVYDQCGSRRTDSWQILCQQSQSGVHLPSQEEFWKKSHWDSPFTTSLTRSMKTMVGLQAITPIQWKTGETMPAMPHKPEQTSWDTCLSAFNDISRLWNWTF